MGKKSRFKKIKNTEKDLTQTAPAAPVIPPVIRTILIAVLMASILIIGVSLRVNNLNNVRVRSPDEKTYTYFGETILKHGLSHGIQLLTKEHLANKETWIFYPAPPTRAGYFWMVANAMKVTKSVDVKVGSYISFIASCISLLIVIALGLRIFNPWVTLYALLFMCVSPVDLAIARRTWQDAMVGCIGISLVYFAGEISRNTKRYIWYLLLAVVGSYYISVKESAILIYGLCIMWLLWILFIRKKDFLSGALLVTLFVTGAILAVGAIVYVGGGIGSVAASLRCWAQAIPSNQYMVEYQSGPWYNYPFGFWIVSPISSVLFLIGIAGSSFRIKYLREAMSDLSVANRHAIFGIMLFILVFMAAAIATPHFQNFRYISVMYAPFYLISGLGLWYIIYIARLVLSGFAFYAATFFIIAALILGALRDYSAFDSIFIRIGIRDISIKMLKDYSR